MSLAAKLKNLRNDKKVVLQEVADAVGVSKPHLWEMERGTSKNPSLELIKKIADYYHVPVEYFAEDSDMTEPEMEMEQFFRELKGMSLSAGDVEVLRAAASAMGKKNINRADS